jgi:uncharacterized protein
MSSPFVWFHHNGDRPDETKKLLAALLGWEPSAGPNGMTMLAAGAGPFAALGAKDERYGDASAWIPFVEVEDVDQATKNALSLGASLVKEKSRGPAGEFSIVRDPGGASLGLWRRA